MKQLCSFLLVMCMLLGMLPTVHATVADETTISTEATDSIEETVQPEESEPPKREADPIDPPKSGSCGESATWLLDETGTLTISGTGAVDSSPWSAGDVLKVVIEDGITSIEKSVFYEHANLTEVTFAGSVKGIGEHAFEKCHKLTAIQFAAGLETIGSTAFGYCTGLTEITLPDGLHTLSNRAFMNCTKLETVSIPDSIRSVDDTSFQSCSKLHYTIYDNAKYLGNSENPHAALMVAVGEVPSCIIHEDTVAISGGAFSNIDDLQAITIPAGVKGIGAGAFYSCDGLTTVNIPDGVTTIGKNTFSGCKNLVSVTIGKGLQTLGESAFSGCRSLTKVNIKDLAAWCNLEFEGSEANPLHYGAAILYLNGKAVTKVEYPKGTTAVKPFAFANYQALTGIKLPDSVTYIGEAAFADCGNLTSVTLGKQVSAIHWSAFAYCVKLKNITIPASVKRIDNYAFEYSGITRLTLSEGLETIGEGAFVGCTRLTSVTIPGSVKNLGKDLFRDCTGLTSVTLKSGVPYVADSMFCDCAKLKSVNLPDTVRTIGSNAFYRNHNLSSIKLPNNLERIGGSAFGSGGLKSISIPGSVREIANNAFSGSMLKSATIAEGVTTIGDQAFRACYWLAEITIPSTVTSIGTDAFNKCYRMKTAVIGSGIRVIPSQLFYGCDTLTTVTIPGTVTAINANAFGSCKALSTVYFTGEPEAWTALIDGHSSLQAASVRFPADVSKLSAPKLSLQADGVTLRWTGVPYAGAYEVYRATSKSGKYSLMVTVTDTTWYDPAGSQGTSCYYKIIALRTEPTTLRSSYSNTVSIAYKCDAPVITAEPGTTGKPVISWEKIEGAKKYTVYRATSETGKYSKLGTTTKLTYTDSKAKTGTTYFYKVIANASKSTYNSGYSNIVSCNVICGTPTVTVKIDAATGKPTLSWKKIDGATGYRILRQLPGEEDFTVIKEQTALTFKDTDAPIDTRCIYLVQTMGKTGALDGKVSQPISTTSGIAQPKVTGTVNADGKPSFRWTAIEGAVSYEIYRSTKSTKSYTLLTTVETPEYVDEAVAPGKTYYYKVIAIGQVSKSAESAYVKQTGKCATPEILLEESATAKPALSWEKIEGAKKYTVYRATSETGKYKSIGTTKNLTYTDTKASVGTTYFYKIVANGSSSSCSSGYSNIVSCGVYCAVPKVTLTNNAAGQPVVSWSKVTGATGYQVLYMDVTDYLGSAFGPYGDFQDHHLTATTTKTTFTLPDTQPGRLYMFCVVAVAKNQSFNSQPSEADFVSATCAQPKISGKVGANKKPVLTWKAVEDAAQYVIYRSTKSGSGYEIIGETEDLTTYEDLSAVKGKTYYYKVVAVGYSGAESLPSAYAKVKSK